MSQTLDPGRDPMDGLIVFASPSSANSVGMQENEIQVLWPPPENGIIPTPPDHVMDECPGLVSSDEDDGEFVPASNNDECVKRWVAFARGPQIEEEVEKIKHQGVGLYLLGMETCAPRVWTDAMVQGGVFTSKERIYLLDDLDDKDMLMVEIAEEIFKRIKHIFWPKGKQVLKDILEMIDDIEKNGLSAEVIEVRRALQIAMQCDFFRDEWNKLKEVPKVQKYLTEYSRNDSQPILCSLLFFYKLIHHHVFYYGSHKGTMADKIVKDLFNQKGPYAFNITVAKDEGNKYFRDKNYKEAIKMYSVAMIKDYANPIVYGNRAQCYIYLKEYNKAYCDCRRAIFLNPTWPKAYYRCAQASYYMGKVAEALKWNEEARCACRNSKDLHKDIGRLKDMHIDILRQRLNIMKEMENKKIQTDLDLQTMKVDAKAAIEMSTTKAAAITGDAVEDAKKIITLLDSVQMRHNKPKTRSDSESARSAPGHPPRPQELTDTDKFTLNLKEALEAINLNNLVRAAGKYEAALNLLNHSDKVKSFCRTDQIVVIRYAYGITALSQEGGRTVILESLHVFRSMYKDQVQDNFPLVLYGLGRAYIALYRFAEAFKVVNVQLTKAKRNAWKEVFWPGSQQTIEESKRDVFMREMAKLKDHCKFPPLADAVCFEHVEQDEAKEIYKMSPTYTGMVTMSCFAKCSFKFHIVCWKEYKGKFCADKISEKDMIDRPCPTPDCGSSIYNIIIDRPDKPTRGYVSHEEKVKPRGNHKIGRMTLSNPDKIAKRRERKETKRQKRLEARQKDSSPGSPTLSQSNMEQPNSDLFDFPHSHDGEKEVPVVPLTEDDMVVLHKEGEQDDKYNRFQKQVRQKKKKDKENRNRNILSLDFNFTDDTEREANRVGEQEALEDGASGTKWEKPPRLSVPLQQISSIMPEDNVFAMPARIREQCESFSNIVAKMPSRNPSQLQREEEIKATFNGYMYDFLREAGPQHLQSQRMLQELEDIPEEVNRVIKQCGGIRKYFEMNEDFFVAGQHVGVETDAEKVCKMSDHLLDSASFHSTSSIPTSNTSLASRPVIHSVSPSDSPLLSRPLIASTNHYSFNTPSTCITDAAIDEANDSVVHKTNSQQTHRPYENSWKTTVEHASPSISDLRLNPTAPEFQPGAFLPQDQQGSPRDQQILTQEHLQGSVADVDTDDECSQLEASASYSSKTACYNNVDSVDTFTSNGIDDIDDYDFNEMDKIDEADIDPAPIGNDYLDIDDFTEDHPPVAPEVASRRSSKSDLSQTSDFSTGGLFRGASPSSSASSHKGASNRDVASPFSARDTSSPGFPGFRAAEAFRRTSSPGVTSSLHSPLDTKSELGLGAGFATSIALSSHNGDHLSYNSFSGADSVMPKPLKPLIPSVSLGSAVGDNGLAVINTGASLIGGNSSTIATSDSFSMPSLTNQPLLSLSSSLGFTGGFPSASSTSSTWGPTSSLSGSTWSTNTFPTALRPEEDVVNSIPPFPTSHLFSHSSSDMQFTPTPAPIPFPSYSSSSSSSSVWSTGKEDDWSRSRMKVMEKVEQGIQAAVDVRSVEVNTELTGCQLMVQHQSLLQQLQHMHTLCAQLQQDLKNADEEKTAVRREFEERKLDLTKAVQQLGNLEADYASVKDNLRGLQEQNKMSAMETNNLMQKVSHLEDQCMKERKRAVHAEVQVIQEQIENFKIHLDKKIKESEMHNQQVTNNIQSYQEANPGQPIPKQLEERQAYAQKVVECWASKKVDIMRQLKEQQEQILAGKLQSELPRICIFPNLPTPPDDMVGNSNGTSSHPAMTETWQHTSLQFPSSTDEFFSSTSSSTLSSSVAAAAIVAQPRTKDPPGLSASRLPNPLRPPLGLSGMTLPTRPSGSLVHTSTDPAKTQAAPPPLRPISTSKVLTGALQPRTRPPLLGACPSFKPVGVAATVPPRPAGNGMAPPPQQSSFSKMVVVLQKSFPQCDRDHFSRAIQELRQAHNGSLTGLSLEFIVRQVTNMLIARGFTPQPRSPTDRSVNGASSNKDSEVKRTAPPPGLSAAWSVEGLEPLASDRFVEEEDPCAICHEELSAAPVQILECAHRFHDHCIRTWFKQQTTCPKCRTYAPLLDDYPSLK